MVAGVYALVAEARGATDPEELRHLDARTAIPNKWRHTQDYLSTVLRQGSSLIQASDATHATTILSKSSLTLKDNEHFEGKQTFGIKNTGDEDVTYSLSYFETPAVYFLGPDTLTPASPVTPVVDGAPWVGFESKEVVVAAGDSAKCQPKRRATSRSRRDAAARVRRIHRADRRQRLLSVPFFGILVSLYGTPTMHADEVFLYNSSDQVQPEPKPANKTFELPRPTEDSPDNPVMSGPAPNLNLITGMPVLRIDILSPSKTDLPMEDGVGYESLGQCPTSRSSGQAGVSIVNR